jgi:hypothetical protein
LNILPILKIFPSASIRPDNGESIRGTLIMLVADRATLYAALAEVLFQSHPIECPTLGASGHSLMSLKKVVHHHYQIFAERIHCGASRGRL